MQRKGALIVKFIYSEKQAAWSEFRSNFIAIAAVNEYGCGGGMQKQKEPRTGEFEFYRSVFQNPLKTTALEFISTALASVPGLVLGCLGKHGQK